MKSAAEIAENMRRALKTRNYTAFVDGFDDEDAYELPFVLKGRPSRYEGIDKIREFFSPDMTARNELFELHRLNVNMHPRADGSAMFAEYSLEGKTISTGELFKIPSSTVIITCTCRNGK